MVQHKERPPCIPQAVLEARAMQAEDNPEKERKKLERDLENENGLEELEQEEGALQDLEEDDDFEMDGAELTPGFHAALSEIRKKKSLLIQQHRIKKSTAESRPTIPRKFDKDKKFTSERMGRQLSTLGLDPSEAIESAREKSRSGKRARESMEVDGGQQYKKMRLWSRSRSRSRSLSGRSQSRPPGEVVPGEGFKDFNQKKKAIEIAHSSNKKRNKEARRGEADRVIPTLKPKHLFSGKRSKGKTGRR